MIPAPIERILTDMKEIQPVTIPVICHVYGESNEPDPMEKATILFDEICYHIERLSHGLITYKQEVFVRVPEDLKKEKVFDCSVFSYLDWAKDQSILDRILRGFRGEIWFFTQDGFTNAYISPLSRFMGLAVMSFDTTFSYQDALVCFGERIKDAGLDNTSWHDDTERLLARVPDKIWKVAIIRK